MRNTEYIDVGFHVLAFQKQTFRLPPLTGGLLNESEADRRQSPYVGYDRATKALPKADLEHNAEFKKFAATQLLAS